jgi:hypothetical protein
MIKDRYSEKYANYFINKIKKSKIFSVTPSCIYNQHGNFSTLFNSYYINSKLNGLIIYNLPNKYKLIILKELELIFEKYKKTKSNFGIRLNITNSTSWVDLELSNDRNNIIYVYTL